MTTAVDTNVLIDVFRADATFGKRSSAALRHCGEQGDLIACEVVWAEMFAVTGDEAETAAAMRRLGVRFVPMDESSSLVAGSVWDAYRCNGGTRRRVVADFLVGAHAAVHAEQLLTRDGGFRRRWFGGLRVLDRAR